MIGFFGCDDDTNDPTTIENTPTPTAIPITQWESCAWVEVGALASHNQGAAWCSEGNYLTQFDLDSPGNVSDHDSPIVGQARCCKGTASWGTCAWAEVGAIASHNQGAAWCQEGSFLTQFDLDSPSNISNHDSPIVGRAMCCKAANSWGTCSWVEVGAIASHNQSNTWCPNGSFLTQFDLDSPGNVSDHDSPIVGWARCCSLGQ